MIKSALQLYNRFIEKGQIDSQTDSELYLEYKKEEVRSILSDFEEELDFRLLDVGNTIYLIPNLDNDLIGYHMTDIRENVASSATLTEAYLQTYIIMTIFYLFYGGKNNNPIQREFIQTRDLIEELDKRTEGFLNNRKETEFLEEEHGINFAKVAEYWCNKQISDATSRKTKEGTILKAYKQLEKEHLIKLLEDNREIRRTKKLDDIFVDYYLDENRVKELHSIFDKGVSTDGKN